MTKFAPADLQSQGRVRQPPCKLHFRADGATPAYCWANCFYKGIVPLRGTNPNNIHKKVIQMEWECIWLSYDNFCRF